MACMKEIIHLERVLWIFGIKSFTEILVIKIYTTDKYMLYS